jgi:hypothetical protein
MTNDTFIDYVKTMVRGDHEANDRLERSLDAAGWKGWPQFLAAAFFVVVEDRFSRPADPGQIVQFVASMRAEIGDDGPEIDQLLAERMIRSVLDEAVSLDLSSSDQQMVGKIQTLVTYVALSDVSETERDKLLGDAAALVSRNA